VKPPLAYLMLAVIVGGVGLACIKEGKGRFFLFFGWCRRGPRLFSDGFAPMPSQATRKQRRSVRTFGLEPIFFKKISN